ncbi:hypothetical protein QBZ16_002672 [Prototheca wickerhamii]|uniref:Uncharacterized protein n=1 Tax=Prototheca wickerhamii TaxID=3111 RepID=A0AAD9IMH2_PROWI|nr:hypothetical protein QBZ16_002672 [Prototheca wickerhamii]
MAAIQRAKRRKDALLRTLEHAARLEPFHLKRERAQGHFDPETGAYVPHAAERPIVADAWADELPVLENEEEDDASSSASDDAGDVAGLLDADNEEDPVALRHMCGALRPGETILGALRRIGRQRREAPSSAAFKRSTMTPEASAAFERLTDAGAKLMRVSGDFAGRRPEPARAAEPEVDMFAAEDDNGTASPATPRDAPGEGAAHASLPAPPLGDGAAQRDSPAAEEAPRIPDGFQPDPSTGVWVNAHLGCTFDPVTQVYGDIGTGLQYLWRDGQYHPVGLT